MIKEFRDFINRGNVVELGVAFVMGASFKSLVDVFTKRLIEPLIGLIINLPNLDNLGLFGDVDPSSGMQAGSFGAFLGEIINYTIIAFVMFLVIKAYNHFEDMVDDEEEDSVVVAESKEVQLLKEIRDGINKINTKVFFPLKFEKKINGKIAIVKTIMFVEKLPKNENIWIK